MTTVRIPKLANLWDELVPPPLVVGSPGWVPLTTQDGRPARPLIRCNCGHLMGIGLHHVHVDGRVTASFYHKDYGEGGPRGCEWHVFLELDGYDGPEFPPSEVHA